MCAGSSAAHDCLFCRYCGGMTKDTEERYQVGRAIEVADSRTDIVTGEGVGLVLPTVSLGTRIMSAVIDTTLYTVVTGLAIYLTLRVWKPSNAAQIITLVDDVSHGCWCCPHPVRRPVRNKGQFARQGHDRFTDRTVRRGNYWDEACAHSFRCGTFRYPPVPRRPWHLKHSSGRPRVSAPVTCSQAPSWCAMAEAIQGAGTSFRRSVTGPLGTGGNNQSLSPVIFPSLPGTSSAPRNQ